MAENSSRVKRSIQDAGPRKRVHWADLSQNIESKPVNLASLPGEVQSLILQQSILNHFLDQGAPTRVTRFDTTKDGETTVFATQAYNWIPESPLRYVNRSFENEYNFIANNLKTHSFAKSVQELQNSRRIDYFFVDIGLTLGNKPASEAGFPPSWIKATEEDGGIEAVKHVRLVIDGVWAFLVFFNTPDARRQLLNRVIDWIGIFSNLIDLEIVWLIEMEGYEEATTFGVALRD